MSKRGVLEWLAAPALAALLSCGNQPEAAQVSSCTGSTGHLKGNVISSAGGPLGQVLIAIEAGGIYVHNADTSKGNPSYRYAALTDNDGYFDVVLPCAPIDLGLHAYQDGYKYGSRTARVGESALVSAPPLKPGEPTPTLSGSTLSASKVAPGAAVTVETTAAAGSPTDPLSEEVLLFEPTQSWSKALDPPSAGNQGLGFPDGKWRTTFTAPAVPGDYVYSLIATSEACVGSPRVSLRLTVQ